MPKIKNIRPFVASNVNHKYEMIYYQRIILHKEYYVNNELLKMVILVILISVLMQIIMVVAPDRVIRNYYPE